MTEKKPRITWKQAFSLLKRVALQKYRLKYFVYESHQAYIKEKLDQDRFGSEETAFYHSHVNQDKSAIRVKPRDLPKKRSSELASQPILLTNVINDVSKTAQSDQGKQVADDGIDTESLAMTIVNGKVYEIKKRSK